MNYLNMRSRETPGVVFSTVAFRRATRESRSDEERSIQFYAHIADHVTCNDVERVTNQ